MIDIKVAQATIQDLNAVVPLFDEYRQFYGMESNLVAAHDFLLERFKNLQSIIFIATDSDSVVGFVQLYPSFSSVSLKKVYILNDIYVTENSRHLGVATLLMQSAMEYAKSMGAGRISLTTANTNSIAQKVYEKNNWEKDGDHQVYHFFFN